MAYDNAHNNGGHSIPLRQYTNMQAGTSGSLVKEEDEVRARQRSCGGCGAIHHRPSASQVHSRGMHLQAKQDSSLGPRMEMLL